MSEETLLTAARRVVRDFRIDCQHGGLMSKGTQQSVETLDKMVRRETGKTTQAALDSAAATDAKSPRT